MADEITFRIGITTTKSGSESRFPTTEFEVDMAGDDPLDFRQNIGTSAENVIIGDAGAGHWVFAWNLSDINYVELGYDDTGFVDVAKMGPGEPCGPLRWSATKTLQARANTGACTVRFIIIPA